MGPAGKIAVLIAVFIGLTSEVGASEGILPVQDKAPGLGEKLSLYHCGRCHRVSERNRMGGIGSTPSFRLLRSFEDWEGRFWAFYALKPHPAFTQIDGITEPFHEEHPSPIHPVMMTQEDLEAIVAFVRGIEPADLGGPLNFR